MSLPTREETLTEFCGYVRDICSQPPDIQGNRLETVLARLMDTAVRIAASQLVPIDVDIAAWSDQELAEAMRQHVVSRDGVRLKNSAWHMMIEAAGRLHTNGINRTEAAMRTCRWCGRQGDWPEVCMSTRDMEERDDPICDAELMKCGGGERSTNQRRARTKAE